MPERTFDLRNVFLYALLSHSIVSLKRALNSAINDLSLRQTRFSSGTKDFPFLHELSAIIPALLDINAPNNDRCSGTDCEKKGEAHPVVAGGVDDGLYDIGPDNAGGPVGDSKQPKEHILVAARGNLGHHSLRVCVIGRLKKAENDVVEVELPAIVVADLVGPETDHSI